MEEYIRELGIPATFFMPGFYMTNIPGQILRPGAAAGQPWTFNLPIPEHTSQMPLFYPPDAGKWIKAMDIVHYLDRTDVKQRHKLKKSISVVTAQWWMRRMGYRWQKNPAGQFVDGHERDDVIYYRQTVFIPAWTEF